MYQILSKNDYRKVTLLRMMAEDPNPKKSAWLAQRLHCSERVVELIIREMKKDFHSFLSWKKSEGGWHIQFKEGSSFFDIIQKIYRKQPICSILELVFSNQFMDIKQLQERLFISQSTIYRMIQKFNERVGKYYRIHLASKPYRMEGDELSIRRFFTRFFLELYTYYEYPFENIERSAVEELIQTAIRIYGATVDFACYQRALVTSVVSIIRYKQGHRIQTQQIKPYVQELMLRTFQDRSGFEPLEERLGVRLDEEFVLDVFFQYTMVGFYLNMEDMLNDIDLLDISSVDGLQRIYLNHPERRLSERSIHLLGKLILKLSIKHNLTIDSLHRVIVEIHNHAFMECFGIGTKPLFIDETRLYFSHLRRKSPVFFEDLNDMLSAYYRTIFGEPKPYILRNLAMVTLCNWKDFFKKFLESHHKETVYILSHSLIQHGSLLRSKLERIFGDQVRWEVYTRFDVRIETLEELPCRFLISTFPLPPLKTKKVLRVEGELTSRNLQMIFQEFFKEIDGEQSHEVELSRKVVKFLQEPTKE